jgi:predicted regulator of Ras-like GTPase activity (Roadblock/LC7/MglB family)
MDWFERLAGNQHIEMVMLANNDGRILRSSRPMRSSDELMASMFQAAEVLAQTLADEFELGSAEMVQISTQYGHLMLFPLARSTHYVVVVVERTAPYLLLMVEITRVLKSVTPDDLAVFAQVVGRSDDFSELDAAELIEAVREWLQQRPLE